MLPRRYQLPAITTGYPLNPAREWVSVVMPRATTNLFTNPSAEVDTAGWTVSGDGGGGVLQRTDSAQYRGAYAFELIIDGAGSYAQMVSTGNATAGTVYSLTAHAKRYDGTTVAPADLQAVYNGAAQPFQRAAYSADGWWRLTSTFLATAAPVGVRVTGAGDDALYLDALQWEAGDTPTTYCDGDERGLLPLESPPAYRWNGTPHASTSSRSPQTRAGGTVHLLSEYGATLVALAGLGAAPVANAATPLGLADGSIYQQTTREARGITLGVRFQGQTAAELAEGRGALRAALMADRTQVDQPVRLILQKHSGERALGDEVWVDCSYLGGLEGQEGSLSAEDASVQLMQWSPGLVSLASQGGAVAPAIDLGSASQRATIRTPEGEVYVSGSWGAVFANTLFFARDGSLYAGLAGAGSHNYIARSTDGGASWSSLGTGLNGQVFAITEDRAGNIYVGGAFTTAGGGGANRIARWNGSAWAALGTGLNDVVRALAYDPVSNDLYVGGEFTTAGGNAWTYLAFWDIDGGSWQDATVGGNLNNDVWALYFDIPTSTLYVGGIFTSDGTTTLNRIATTRSAGAFQALGTGANAVVYSIAADPSGLIYVGGEFTSIGGVTATGLARWNGAQWQLPGAANSGFVYTVAASPADDSLIIAGVAGLSIQQGNSRVPIDFVTGGTVSTAAVATDGTIAAVLNNPFIADPLDLGGRLTAPTPIVVRFVRDDSVTAARTISLAGVNPYVYIPVTLAIGETIELRGDLTPPYESNLRGSRFSGVSSASRFDGLIARPENAIVKALGGTADDGLVIDIYCQPVFLSLDDTVR